MGVSRDHGMNRCEGRSPSCLCITKVLAWWLVVWACYTVSIVSGSSSFSLEVTHRFSEKARRELRERQGVAFRDWPPQGTAEYNGLLYKRDLHRHGGRILAAATNKHLLASSQGNLTYFWENDRLQYTYVEIGTPSQVYFVALDTGSDLLWVPCADNCISCAPQSSPLYSGLKNNTLNRYNPSSSTTYLQVNCGSSLCELGTTCSRSTDRCPYIIQYLSPASTTGYLVQDVMYLIPQKGGPKTATDIVFGCGRNQSGEFLQVGSVPDGLMGLGMRDVSVPSFLAKANVVQNSFSMCFDAGTGSGRLVFGDRGPPSAPSTPIIKTDPPSYWVGLYQVIVGGVPAVTQTIVLFDTGTTFTYLSPAPFAAVTSLVASQISYQRVSDQNQIFDYCYLPPSLESTFPSIFLEFTGRAMMEASVPYFSMVDRQGNIVQVCLAIVNSQSDTSIIGHNFMVNHSITFDRVSKKISWFQTSCDNYQTFVGDYSSPSPSPAPLPLYLPTSPAPLPLSPPTSPASLFPSSAPRPPPTVPSSPLGPSAGVLPYKNMGTSVRLSSFPRVLFTVLLSAYLWVTLQRHQ